jgi:acetyl-CoA synthetase
MAAEQQFEATPEMRAADLQISEAQIAVHWREEEYYQPPVRFIGQANAADPAIFDRFHEHRFPECFKE